MRTIVVEAPAKINLYLDVVGVRPNGYHELAMVMQAIDLADQITLRWQEDASPEVGRTSGVSISLLCDDKAMPTDERNTAYQAVQAVDQFLIERVGSILLPSHLEIEIQKKIPEQAGLGGSSADAAGVLCGLAALLEQRLVQVGVAVSGRSGVLPLDITSDAWMSLAKSVGADVPFGLLGGTAAVSGIGEVIRPLPPLPALEVLIVKPEGGVSTKEAFSAYDRWSDGMAGGLVPQRQEALVSGIEMGSLAAIGSQLYNALEAVCPLCEVSQIKQALGAFGAVGCLMTGSGSAVFGLFPPDGEEIQRAEASLRGQYPTVLRSCPISHGARVSTQTAV